MKPKTKHGRGEPGTPLPALLAELKEVYRQRTDLHGAEKKLTLQVKAIARRMNDQSDEDAAPPSFAAMVLLEAQEPIRRKRLELEKRLREIAVQLPVWPTVDAIHGMGALGLAIVAGEAGDLLNYPNPAKLWKRMGLAVFNGKSQRRVKGAGAIEQGYNPRRRSAMWTVGDSLLKKKNEYKTLYDARKAYEHERNGLLPPMTGPKNSVGKRTPLPGERLTDMQLHRRAQRYVEKRLLLDLWKAWRGASLRLEPWPALHRAIPLATTPDGIRQLDPAHTLAASAPPLEEGWVSPMEVT